MHLGLTSPLSVFAVSRLLFLVVCFSLPALGFLLCEASGLQGQRPQLAQTPHPQRSDRQLGKRLRARRSALNNAHVFLRVCEPLFALLLAGLGVSTGITFGDLWHTISGQCHSQHSVHLKQAGVSMLSCELRNHRVSPKYDQCRSQGFAPATSLSWLQHL